MNRASSNCTRPACRSACFRSLRSTLASSAWGQKPSLAVVSRGVVEAESKHTEFGLEGVKRILQAAPAAARNGDKDLSQRILQGVQDFMHRAPKRNDMTALTLTRGD